MIKLKKLIYEGVHGIKAIVYHRTDYIETFKNILNTGFTPGNGDMYGKGLYATYTPTTNDSANSSTYGPIQIKFMVEIIDFFIFNYDIYIKSTDYVRNVEEYTKEKSNKNNFIQLQAKYYNIPIPPNIESYQNNPYTSDIALEMGFNSNHRYYNKVNGIIFTGRHDGNVLVCYNTKLAVPISYSNDATGEVTHLKDIKNLDSFIQRYRTTMKEKMIQSTSLKTINDVISRYSFIKFNHKTKLYDIKEDFILTEDFIKNGKLRVKFGIASKNFSASDLSLTSLEGFPKYVGGACDIYLLNITSLKGCPEIVHDRFTIRSCHQLKNLEYSPKGANSYHIRWCTNLKSLNGITKNLNFMECFNCAKLTQIPFYPLAKSHAVDIYVYNTLDQEYKSKLHNEKANQFKETYLQRYINKFNWKINPKTDKIDVNGMVVIQPNDVFMGKILVEFGNVYGDFTFYNVSTDMATLKNCPTYVKGDFSAVACKHIKTLIGSPKIVDGHFSISGCENIETLIGSPERVGESFSCVSCHALKSLEGAPKEVGGEFNCADCKSLESLEHLPKAKNYYVPHHLRNELRRILKERGES